MTAHAAWLTVQDQNHDIYCLAILGVVVRVKLHGAFVKNEYAFARPLFNSLNLRIVRMMRGSSNATRRLSNTVPMATIAKLQWPVHDKLGS